MTETFDDTQAVFAFFGIIVSAVTSIAFLGIALNKHATPNFSRLCFFAGITILLLTVAIILAQIRLVSTPSGKRQVYIWLCLVLTILFTSVVTLSAILVNQFWIVGLMITCIWLGITSLINLVILGIINLFKERKVKMKPKYDSETIINIITICMGIGLLCAVILAPITYGCVDKDHNHLIRNLIFTGIAIFFLTITYIYVTITIYKDHQQNFQIDSIDIVAIVLSGGGIISSVVIGFDILGIHFGRGLLASLMWIGGLNAIIWLSAGRRRKKKMATIMGRHEATWEEKGMTAQESQIPESPSTELAIPSGLDGMQDHLDVIKQRKEITEEQMVGLAKELYTIALYLPNQITWIENCSMSVKLEIKSSDEHIKSGLEVSFWLREPIDNAKIYWKNFMNRVNDKMQEHRRKRKQPQKSGAYFVTKNWMLEGSTMSTAMAGLIVPARILAQDRLLELHTETVADIEFLRSQGEMEA